MKLAELQHALRTADPAAVLVSPRVLDRLIQQVWDLPSLVWEVPHRKVFVIDRHVLFRHVEQDELDLEAERLLPPTVILLARPSVEKLTDEKPEAILLQYWRRLFHANVHLALNGRNDKGGLSPAVVAERIAQLGRTEFEEVRNVLSQDHYLPSRFDDATVYREFAAVYLELHYFASHLLPIYFPGLRDLPGVDKLLGRDLDAQALFEKTRLSGASDPDTHACHKTNEAHDYFWKLMDQAESAGRSGNLVRAAILRTQATRVAPSALSLSTRAEAEADLQKLMSRLQAALQLSDLDVGVWLKDLSALLDKADQGSNPVEAALLYDLQNVCLEHEHEIYSLDVVEWLLSGGKRPIQRPMPLQKLVRVLRLLRTAEQRLALARISEADRRHFGQLLRTALEHSDQRLRERCVPVLSNALEDVGLAPQNPPERLAFQKMIEELLDRITAFGFVTFTDLRDTISRNQLKLPDLNEPQDFIRGDALLCLDRRLGTALDGVYRRSTFYMRWLERMTALNFGTVTGRLITKYVTVPYGGSFLLLETIKKVVETFDGPTLSMPLTLVITALLGLFLLAFMHVEVFRRRCVEGCRLLYRGARAIVVDVPLQVLPLSAVRRIVESWPFQLFYWYVVKPAVVCTLLWLWKPQAFQYPAAVVFAFLAISLLINSRIGKAINEALTLAVVNLYELLRAGLLPGLFRMVVRLFKRVTETVEYVLYSVDEWLRFRGGESRLTMVLLLILSVLWFPVAYLARFYVVVLIEPGINPVKFPFSTVAAKFLYPLMFVVWELPKLLAEPLTPFLGSYLSYGIAFCTVSLLPDAFGFLFWETKENWSLYRANRSATLRPVAMGPHGETVHRLLAPGFHSGTLPKLYARLRDGEREGVLTGNWLPVRTCRHALHEVERSLRLFLDRELISLLSHSVNWQQRRLCLGQITLATNRILAELLDGTDAPPLTLQFELSAGWLVASIAVRGWLDHLLPPQRQALTSALAGLYKLSGVGLVREQVEAVLPASISEYEITPEGLNVFPDHRRDQPLVYDLRDADKPVSPRRLGTTNETGPALDPRRLVFARTPLYWHDWVKCWQKEQDGVALSPLEYSGRDLVAVRHDGAAPATNGFAPPRA
jgi:hypothetical protein